ncbi:phospholipid phosphatase 1-like isoform X2 [Leguminivora glycinivorella]|uniref:phospholipid phosphatase 1-like isoform X2 n=1 Tax=Leguminivora glycinivorella TaxID=1035111 RepID=UPI00200EDDAD|nr:phospholipid phosphatase 1-like isoform X2 [Leguminivora glycinivorella]
MKMVLDSPLKTSIGEIKRISSTIIRRQSQRRDLESQCTSNSTERKHSLWWNVFLDIPIIAAVVIVVGLYEFAIIPSHKSGFFCNDPKLSFQFKGDTVNEVVLVTTVFFMPLIAFFITEIILLDSNYLRSRPLEALKRTGLLYRNYIYGFIFNLLVVEILKGLSGMPRPIFFDMCKPDTGVNCTTGEYIDTFECTSSYSWWKQYDSYHSFPSGHTSMSVYCGLFIAWYLQRRAFSWSSRSIFLVPLVQICCIGYAAVCSLSRITDHRHHWWDVAAGMVVGVVTVLFAIFPIGDNFAQVRVASVPKTQHSSTDLLYVTARRPVS